MLVPTHGALDEHGQTALDSIEWHLGGHDLAFMGPGERPVGSQLLHTPDWYWNAGDDGRRGYNPLMCARGLYETIEEGGYTHVLVHQPDAITFSNRLEEFCELDVDYIGAVQVEPHPELPTHHDRGGNGGYSLRRVSAALSVLDGLAEWPTIDSYYQHVLHTEDLFWSFVAPLAWDGFRPAQINDCIRFSWEVDPALCWLANGRALPMGAHAYMRWSPEFWANLGGVRTLAGLPASP